jgi:hypothetical protein
MKLKPEPRWLLLPRVDLLVDRSAEPTILDLSAAVEWVKQNKPLLWVGSIFSVPQPSGFPSGYAITRSLFDLIFPTESRLPEDTHERFLSELTPRWPLEALLDQFELLGFDLSESLLGFFADHNRVARPNTLHNAVVRYYERGYSGVPLCVTTNWDTLLERAFHARGYAVQTAGPSHMPDDRFGKAQDDAKIISVYHPHGSFETEDVVCSSFQEQQQLSLHMEFKFHPILFLGYSGYEPSLYRHLEYTAAQLWCIRDEADLHIPAKRRLLARRNTYVFVGDMLDLLRALHVLDDRPNLSSDQLGLDGPIPSEVIEVVHCAIAAALNPRFCARFLVESLLSHRTEPESAHKFRIAVDALQNHVRDRVTDHEVPLSLMAASHFVNDEQLWIGVLAYLLRSGQPIGVETIDDVLTRSEEARKEEDGAGGSAAAALLRTRARCYRSFLGRPEREDDDVKDWKLNSVASTWLGNMALAAELMELAGFACLRDGDDDRAAGYLDTAATYYYLTGLWNAGQLNEWASRNIDVVRPHAKQNTLRIPMEPTKTA